MTWFIIIMVLLCVDTVNTSNWPNWRGPMRNGVSEDTNLPTDWNTEKNIAWKLEMPTWSGSTPVVWNDLIFLNVAVDNNTLELWCLNRNTGQLVWKQHLSDGNSRQRKQNMSSPSPVTDGVKVWVITGTGILKAFDFQGNNLWTRDIQKSYGAFGLSWGYASSPLLHSGAIYLQVLHGMRTNAPSYLLSIDAETGKTIWRVQRFTEAIRESPDSYSTPTLLQYDGTEEIIVTGGDAVTGHALTTGEELWRADGLNPTRQRNYRIVASPIVYDGLIYAPTRVRPLLALRPGGRGNVLNTNVIWSTNNGPDVPTPITDGQYFYIINDQGIVYVHNAKTGELVYGRKRINPGTYSASPVLADGKIYITNEAGLTTVLKTGPTFEELSRNPLNDYCLSSPAISDGQIFIRTAKYLWAIGTRQNP